MEYLGITAENHTFPHNGAKEYMESLHTGLHEFVSFFLHKRNSYQGQIQDFIEEEAPKLKTDRTSVPVGTGGVWGECPLSEAENICNFQS